MSPERVVEHWPRVQEAAERNGRDPASLQLFTSTPVRNDRSLADLLGEYREIGVDHVQVGLHRSSREETLDTMRDVAENVIPNVRG
jgi:hypothetical protein